MPLSHKSLSLGKICLLYALLSGSWVLILESLMRYLIGDHQLLLRLSVFKGWFLILFTIAFFYYFMGRIWKEQKDARLETIRTVEKQDKQLGISKRQEGFFLGIYESVTEGVIVQHISGAFFNANSAARELLDISLTDIQKNEDILTKIIPWLDEKGEPFSWKAHASNVLAGAHDTKVITHTLKRFDPAQRWLNLNGVLLLNTKGEPRWVVSTLSDISMRKYSELQETILYGITQRILAEQPLSIIFNYICDVLVDSVGYPVAAIGLKKAEGSVAIVAQAGVREEYIRTLNIRWDDSPEGQGAVGEAIRTGKPQAQNLVDNPQFKPWWAIYEALNLQSIATIPLWAHGQCLGVIALYAHLQDHFDIVLIERLQSLAEQITVALLAHEDRSKIQFQSMALSSIGDGVITTDVQANITYLNPVAERLTGWSNKQAEGLPLLSVFNILNENTGLAVVNPVTQCLREKRIVALANHTELIHRDGTTISIEDSAAPICNRLGELIGAVLVFHDVSDKRALVYQLSHQAHHDALTGLPNRILFKDRAQQAIAQAQRHQTYVALLFLDLDRFKLVNDTLGHAVGDQLLRAIGERLSACLREGDTVSRQGGDEFLILLPEMRSEDDVAQVAQKLMDVFVPPFYLQEQAVYITASLGIVLFPTDGGDIETLIKYADTAMYHAKEEGRNRYQFYTLAFNQALSERLSVQNDLRRALACEELVLYYQPQYRISDGQMCGMEALVRWQHPEKGFLLPGEFISIAEESGLILPLGEWVLRSACRQNKLWQEMGYPPIRVAVNLSARQFRQANLASQINLILTETGLDPQWLELEITESISMENSSFAQTTLQELKGMGIHLSMDDFGTGFSSLSYLSEFSLDTLKIDRLFVSALTTRSDGRESGNEIVTTIIQLARNLGLRVIAEGVETEAQLEFLRSQGCAEAQGYLLARPVPAEVLVYYLSEIDLHLNKKLHKNGAVWNY